jgi:uncharacterized protein YkwD
MKTKALIFSILSFLAVTVSTKVFAQKELESQVLEEINKYRTEHGMKPFKEEPSIIAGARKHSNDMATGKVPFGHDGFDQRMSDLMRQLAPANACAENVAEGANTAKEVVALWLHSPGHKKNIEGNYNLSGIGIATSKDGTKYYTQIFIHKQ